MKKLLGVSIAAMLAVTPMIASADPSTGNHLSNAAPSAPAGTGVPPFKAVTVDTAANIATTSYVQGAYNDAIAAINMVATTAGAAQTEGQVKTAIGNAAGDGLTGDTTNGTLTVNNGNGLEIGTDTDAGKLKVKAGNSTITVDSDGVKVGTITDSNITDGTISQSKINGLSTTFGTKQNQLKNSANPQVNISDTVYTSMNTNVSGTGENQARDNVLVTEAAIANALNAVKSGAVITGGAGIDNTNNTISVDLVTTNPTLQITNNKLEAKVGDGLQAGSTGIEAKLHTNGGLNIDSTSKGIKVVVDGTTIENNNGTLQVKSGIYDAINSASTAKNDIETKLTAGASGYEINAKSLQVQGSDVSTQTGVTATISNSTVPVFTAWGADTTTNVYVKSAAYTTTARANGVAN